MQTWLRMDEARQQVYQVDLPGLEWEIEKRRTPSQLRQDSHDGNPPLQHNRRLILCFIRFFNTTNSVYSAIFDTHLPTLIPFTPSHTLQPRPCRTSPCSPRWQAAALTR